MPTFIPKDSPAVTNCKKYFQEKLAAGGSEFDQLDQGIFMTTIRYDFVYRNLEKGAHVLDFACGNGNILYSLMVEVRSWIGVDFMPERRVPFLNRLANKNIDGGFFTSSASIQELVRQFRPDTVVLCGILGCGGFTDWQAMVRVVENIPCRIIATVPVTTPNYEETVIARFDEDEVRATSGVVVEKLYDGLLGAVWA
jgi:hypothetical protein